VLLGRIMSVLYPPQRQRVGHADPQNKRTFGIQLYRIISRYSLLRVSPTPSNGTRGSGPDAKENGNVIVNIDNVGAPDKRLFRNNNVKKIVDSSKEVNVDIGDVRSLGVFDTVAQQQQPLQQWERIQQWQQEQLGQRAYQQAPSQDPLSKLQTPFIGVSRVNVSMLPSVSEVDGAVSSSEMAEFGRISTSRKDGAGAHPYYDSNLISAGGENDSRFESSCVDDVSKFLNTGPSFNFNIVGATSPQHSVSKDISADGNVGSPKPPGLSLVNHNVNNMTSTARTSRETSSQKASTNRDSTTHSSSHG
jgi:hypothetical protein